MLSIPLLRQKSTIREDIIRRVRHSIYIMITLILYNLLMIWNVRN